MNLSTRNISDIVVRGYPLHMDRQACARCLKPLLVHKLSVVVLNSRPSPYGGLSPLIITVHDDSLVVQKPVKRVQS